MFASLPIFVLKVQNMVFWTTKYYTLHVFHHIFVYFFIALTTLLTYKTHKAAHV